MHPVQKEALRAMSSYLAATTPTGLLLLLVKYLWLLPFSNKPDPSKGLFKDIYNVFEVDCGQPSAENLFSTNGKGLKVLLKQLRTSAEKK